MASFFMANIRQQILERKQAASDYLSTKRDLWDEVEQLFHNQLTDSISKNTTKSNVFDPKLTTLILERGYRVMAQLATGKVKPISTNDIGSGQLMNLILDKWVIPNANAQFDLLTKFRMTDIYSNLYGNFFALVDMDVKKNGYVGPDLWLLNIRDVFPQVGAVSVEDSDYIIVRTWKPLSFFENLKGQRGYKNITEIVTRLKGKTGDKEAVDSDSKGQRAEDQYPTGEAAKNGGFFEVLTQYEGDRWVDYCVEADMEFRDQANPHENGELPVVCKYSIPLLDDFMGMGDFERGKTMQMVVNSVWNLYLDAVKMSIFPPILINKDNLASESSIQWGAAAKWLVRGQINNAISPVQLNPQGIQTFNNTYQVASSAILNMFGTTDTSVTQQTEVGYGKTPKALQMQQNRENTRDNADRFYMEMFVKKVMKKMVNLLSKKQSRAITIRLFGDEIEQLKRNYPEIEEMYSQESGKLSIPKSKTGSVLYDYEIVSGSTYASDQQAQQQNLAMLMEMFMKAQTPNGNWLMQTLQEQGYTLKFGELFKRIVSNSGIQDWDKILEEMTDQEKSEQILGADRMKFEQALMQAQGMNQIPAQQPMPEPMPGQMPPEGGIIG